MTARRLGDAVRAVVLHIFTSLAMVSKSEEVKRDPSLGRDALTLARFLCQIGSWRATKVSREDHETLAVLDSMLDAGVFGDDWDR